MKKTSFGFLEAFDHSGWKFEYLEFDRIHIKKGQTYVVPPFKRHYMKPSGETLKLIVTYNQFVIRGLYYEKAQSSLVTEFTISQASSSSHKVLA